MPWINEYFYQANPGQFGYGWDVFKGSKIIATSGAYHRTKEKAEQDAKDVIKAEQAKSP